jgi:hypothetical protein
VLMVMHVTIALVTYNLLVHLAPARPAAGGAPAGGPPVSEPVPAGPVSASPVSAGPAAAGPGAPVAEQAARGRHRQAR